MPQACGTNCTRPCWCVCANTTRLIGAGPASMAHRCQAPGGPGNRRQSHGPRQTRLQAAHRRRCPGHSTGGAGQWSQPARLHHAREVHRCAPGSQRASGQATPVAIEAACRQGLRLREMQGASAQPWHRQQDCQARNRKQPAPRQTSLGGGEDSRVVCWLRQTAHSIRAQARHSPRAAHAGCRNHLFPLRRAVVLASLSALQHTTRYRSVLAAKIFSLWHSLCPKIFCHLQERPKTMRWQYGMLSICLSSIVLTGCGKESAPPAPPTTPTSGKAATDTLTDQQCSPDHWKTLAEGPTRDDLVSRCMRRGEFKASEPRTW